MSASNINMDIEEYLTNIEENVEYFSDDENTNTQALNDHDYMDIDWSEINLEEFDSVNELSSIIRDEQEVKIEEVSAPNADITPCVIIDIIEGKLRRCNGMADLRPLKQLAGTWEVDKDAVEEANKICHRPGVCQTHYLFDTKHHGGVKEIRSIDMSVVHDRVCLFCHRTKCFFSRG